jgi:hypothetical protein
MQTEGALLNAALFFLAKEYNQPTNPSTWNVNKLWNIHK